MTDGRRFLSRHAGGRAAILLTRACDALNEPEQFRRIMYFLGVELAVSALMEGEISPSKGILVASTAEDFDFLSRGFVDVIRSQRDNVGVACLWMNKEPLHPPGSGETHHVVGEYIELPNGRHVDVVFIKSEIANAKEIRKIVLTLLDIIPAARFHIIAPLAHTGIEVELTNVLFEGISFDIIAHDDGITAHDTLFPGFGKDVASMLGFSGPESVRNYTPMYIRETYEGGLAAAPDAKSGWNPGDD